METWRCPTCLAVLLEHSARRCPTCRTRLRRRGRPIVLGETSRLDVQATLPIDQLGRRPRERGYWNTEAPATLEERRASRRDVDLNPEPVEPSVVAFEYGPVPCAWFDAQAEPEVVEPAIASSGHWSFTSERRGRAS